ncbi:MAG: response regulator [Deltaproteobacteria bacterium]|nr:response regulator [Deltaproteobacteria bacterium]
MEALRVLIVDDEEELVATLVERLEIRGHSPVGVLSGAEALKRAEAEEFDVVVLDIKMPGEDGVEVMKRLKRLRAGLPIILLTGHMSEETSDRGIQAGATEYVIKPVNIDDLVEKLRSAVAASPRRGGAAG